MSIVVDISNQIDAIIASYAQNIFVTTAVAMKGLLQITATFALVLMAVNHVIQFRAINYGQYFHWALRYILIYVFLDVWENFNLIYGALRNLQNDYSLLLIKGAVRAAGTLPSGELFDASTITDANQAADAFTSAMSKISQIYFLFANLAGITHLGQCLLDGLAGVFIFLLGIVFTAISLVILVFAKIGSAVALSLAPLALVLLMLEQTRNYFESWVKFLVGFLIIPLLTSSLMSLMVFTAIKVADQIRNDPSMSPSVFLPLVMLTLGALVFLSQIPTMAHTLSSSSVATVGASLASGRAVMNGARSAGSSAFGSARRIRDGIGIAKTARQNGASGTRTAWAVFNGLRQSAITRAGRRDGRLADRMSGGSASPTKPNNPGSSPTKESVNKPRSADGRISSAAKRVRAAIDSGRTARQNGASSARTAWTVFNSLRQSAGNRDRMSSGSGSPTEPNNPGSSNSPSSPTKRA
ncbi:type IV secretion system protein [Rhizobium ruizarguesonis]